MHHIVLSWKNDCVQGESEEGLAGDAAMPATIDCLPSAARTFCLTMHVI